ncbi:E3 ubiquitin-protein ligase RNF31-like isoform X4 [Corticium candelabrum]|nr:E3 ubiquitin-protein ligase RNF31-like isoform X4 [Corticium candelabrum]XP_062501001.1 E3 ubiquitin-protein ligase RNF31-like isoform X4 [Corticium candelabrum]
MEREQREMEEERQKEERRRQLEVARQVLEAIRRRDKQFFGFLQEGEKRGFEPEEVEIALSTVGNDLHGPISWLVNELPHLLQTIAQLAAKCGQYDYANWQSLGTFGDIETRKYFIECQGDQESTIKAMCEARLKDIIEVRESVNVPHAAICTALMESNGDVLKAIVYLQSTLLQPFVNRIWQEEQQSSDDESENDGLKRRHIPKKVKELVVQDDLDRERRVRVLYAEYNMFSWGRAELAIRLIDERDDQCEYNISDVVDAVEAHQDCQRARDYLRQECPVCMSNFPRDKMISMSICQCSICKTCFVTQFSIVIKEKSLKHMVCPVCGKPSMDDDEVVALHFQTLTAMVSF